MNYKYSLAALAVASVVSGQAMAALETAENSALAALAPVDTWTSANWSQSLDGTTLSNTAAWTDGTDECTWRGVVCDVNGDITHIEIPNSGVTAGMATTLAALAPAASTLVVLNVSNTATPRNTMAGDMSALATFTALTHLAINNTSAEGNIPDLSNSTALNWVNVADNAAITGFGAKLAGGSAISLLNANNNELMAGDVTATLANVIAEPTLNLHKTKLYGTVEAGGTGVTVSTIDGGSDVIVTGTATGTGYDANAVVQPATGVTVTSSDNSATATWVAPNPIGAGTGLNVSYSADEGVTLLGTQALATSVTGATFADIPAGTYKAVVQATGPDGRMSAPMMSDAFVIEDSVDPTDPTGPTDPTDPTTPTCEDGETLNTTTNLCETTPVSSGGGGGAAFWLILAPLMGLLRRKRA